MGIKCRNKLAAVFLLALLFSYKIAVTMFVHTHVVDGTMVAHSHPFTNSNHNHSPSQVFAIGQLSTFNSDELVFAAEIKAYYNIVDEILVSRKVVPALESHLKGLSLRAPPPGC